MNPIADGMNLIQRTKKRAALASGPGANSFEAD